MAVPVQGISLLCLRLNSVELRQPVDGLMKSVIKTIQQKNSTPQTLGVTFSQYNKSWTEIW